MLSTQTAQKLGIWELVSVIEDSQVLNVDGFIAKALSVTYHLVQITSSATTLVNSGHWKQHEYLGRGMLL